MDNAIAPASPEKRPRVMSWGWLALFVLGCLAIVLTTTGFITSWWRNPESFDRGPAAQLGLLAAVAYGLIRLLAGNRLIPTQRHARLMYRLQGQTALWTTFLLLSTGQVGGKTIALYLILVGAVTISNPATAWGDYGANPRPISGWLVRCLAALAAFLWVMSALNPVG